MHSDSSLYADDTKFKAIIKCIEDAIRFQSDLDRVAAWCDRNRLSLNQVKCFCASYHRKSRPIVFDYSIGGKIMGRKTAVRDFGAAFVQEILTNKHVQLITANAFSMLGFVFRVCRDMSAIRAFKTLYCSLIRSILEYCCPVWSPFYQVYRSR